MANAAPAAKLDSLLPLLSRAMRARHEDERLKRRRCDDANEWEEEFVVCEFEGGSGHQWALAPVGAAFMVEGLDSTSPRVRVNGLEFTGKLEEEVGSTLVFDAQRLRALCGEEAAPGDDAERSGGVGDPLVCVTTKRLRLQPALPAATT